MDKYIKGVYKKEIFSTDKGFIIGLFRIKDTNDESMKDYVNKTVTFTGNLPKLNFDETYLFYGNPVKHPRFGFQYEVSKCERIKPEDKDGVIEFLSSDLFPGVGEKIATSIVETLGINALELIMSDYTVLLNVPKLTSKKAAKIYDNLIKYEESHNIIVYLSELGFAIKDCMLIYNKYKSKTENVIEENIYKLIDDIDELSFNKVDEVALKYGINPMDEYRIKAVIIYIMNKLTYNNGDTYLELINIIKETEKFLKTSLNSDYFDQYMYDLEKEGKIIKYNNVYYLSDIFVAENYVAKKIINLASLDRIKYPKMDNYLEHLQKISGIKYNKQQLEAIQKSLENHILIITGGPGTGKTTIIKAIVEMYSQLHNMNYGKVTETIKLLAPTGRASKRMSESTGLPASTIHRFLKWNKETNKFAVDEENKDQSKLFIVDEASMIDIKLLESLFRGIEEDIQFIFVGDYHQLPSVGPGQVLKDLINSNIIDTVFLNHLYRQDEDSYINKLALEIKDNCLSENFMDAKSDFQFLPCNGISIKENLKKLCVQVKNKGYDYKRLQIMAPMYRGENGIDNLNIELQSVFNPPSKLKKEIKYGDVTYRVGDKVLQLVNQPDDNIFNGDIGIIQKIIDSNKSESGKNEIVINYDDNEVTFTQTDFNKFKHAYIISIHKSQGSEFELVILPICSSYKRMLYRKLLYTAVTRAKRKLIVIGEPPAFISCVDNNNEYIRNTSLVEKINEIINNN